MSFRELRNLTEMMRALGYPRPISMENFRKPNFELVSDLLYWMVKKYDPTSSITEEIDTEEDRVQFLTQVATEVLIKARIRLNPKKLYAADGYAVKELIKLSRVLYEASRIDVTKLEADDDDDVSVKSLLGSRVKDPKATRQLSSDITQSGAKLYDLLESELDVRDARTQAIRFLDALSNNSENSTEQKYLERSIKEILQNMQENVELTERQCIDLEAEEKALMAKMKKAQTDLERSEKRLKSLQHVRPAFMDEYEKLEKELERQYAIYCERFRNLDYLQRELDLHNAREMRKLAENDRSLKKLQKKFREDELAILRGEQEDIDPSLLEAAHENNNAKANGKGTTQANNNRKSTPGNQKSAKAKPVVESGATGNGKMASGAANQKRVVDDVGESGSENDEGDDSSEEDSGDDGGAGDGGDSESDEVSLADSGELIDHDDDEEEGSGSEDGEGSEGSHKSRSGSETNSDSDQDF